MGKTQQTSRLPHWNTHTQKIGYTGSTLHDPLTTETKEEPHKQKHTNRGNLKHSHPLTGTGDTTHTTNNYTTSTQKYTSHHHPNPPKSRTPLVSSIETRDHQVNTRN